MLTSDLIRQYGSLTARTLLRDLDTLKEMDLVAESGGKYRAHVELLGPQLARRRSSAGAAAG